MCNKENANKATFLSQFSALDLHNSASRSGRYIPPALRNKTSKLSSLFKAFST